MRETRRYSSVTKKGFECRDFDMTNISSQTDVSCDKVNTPHQSEFEPLVNVFWMQSQYNSPLKFVLASGALEPIRRRPGKWLVDQWFALNRSRAGRGAFLTLKSSGSRVDGEPDNAFSQQPYGAPLE